MPITRTIAKRTGIAAAAAALAGDGFGLSALLKPPASRFRPRRNRAPSPS